MGEAAKHIMDKVINYLSDEARKGNFLDTIYLKEKDFEELSIPMIYGPFKLVRIEKDEQNGIEW